MTKVIGKLRYDPKDQIGQGAFGTVFSGFYARQTELGAIGIVFGVFPSDSTPVAVKQIEMGRAKEDDVQNEVKLMEMAHNHRNILKYLHFEKDRNFMYIATELCRGTLQQYITGKGYKGPKFESEREILLQITQGLAHLHKLDIVHRDINPNNILIYVPSSSDETESYPQVKLADFGRSKVIVDDFTNTSVTNPRGTRGWMAPELYRDQRAGPKVDIFALGLIFGYTLSGGKHPFGDDSDKRSVLIKDEQPMLMVRNDLKEPYSSDDGETYNLIKSTLMMNPDERPTVEEIAYILYFSPANRQKMFESVYSIKNEYFPHDSIVHFEKLLIDQDPIDVNFKFEDGDTLLHIMCRFYKNDDLIYLVELLVKKGGDVKAKSIQGWTPLHFLCFNYANDNLIDIVQLLIKNGAEVSAKDNYGRTPLHLLCYFNENAIKGGDNLKSLVSLFEKNGASMNARDNFRRTPNDFLFLKARSD